MHTHAMGGQRLRQGTGPRQTPHPPRRAARSSGHDGGLPWLRAPTLIAVLMTLLGKSRREAKGRLVMGEVFLPADSHLPMAARS